MDDAELAAQSRRNPPPRQILQCDQPIGGFERAQGGLRIAVDVLVKIGAGESDDQRPIRVELAKAADRGGTAPGVQRDHQLRRRSIVLGRDAGGMPEAPKDFCPAQRRGPVAGP